MRSQLDRDRQTVTIATSLALFALVLLVAVVVALIVEWVTDPPDGLERAYAIASLTAATALSLRYLVANRRP